MGCEGKPSYGWVRRGFGPTFEWLFFGGGVVRKLSEINKHAIWS